LVAGFLLVQGCVAADNVQPGDNNTVLRSEPSVLVIPAGGTSTTTLRAFDGFTNDPVDVAWAIGHVGAGLSIAEDTSFGLVYHGERLSLPARSNVRRYTVTFTGTAASSFVISGDAGVITISVLPAVAAP
jgi:hypothetical protein